MDATGMVKMASNWKSVGEQVITSMEARNLPLSIPAKSKKTSEIVVTAAGRGQVRFLEHVQVGAFQFPYFAMSILLAGLRDNRCNKKRGSKYLSHLTSRN